MNSTSITASTARHAVKFNSLIVRSAEPAVPSVLQGLGLFPLPKFSEEEATASETAARSLYAAQDGSTVSVKLENTSCGGRVQTVAAAQSGQPTPALSEVLRVDTVVFTIACSLADFGIVRSGGDNPEAVVKTVSVPALGAGNMSFAVLRPAWAMGLMRFVVVSVDDCSLGSGKVLVFDDDTETIEAVSVPQPIPSEVVCVDHVAIGLPELLAANALDWLTQTLHFERVRGDSEPDEGVAVRQGTSGMHMLTCRPAPAANSAATGFSVVLVAPLPGACAGQVADFVELHRAGVQHVAFEASDILTTVARIRADDSTLQSGASGLRLVDPRPDTWEDPLERALLAPPSLVGTLLDGVAACKDSKVIVDIKVPGDGSVVPSISEASAAGTLPTHGVLRQIFTLPPSPDCAIFFELIQRENYTGFAQKNIATLFEALEADLTVLYVDEVLGNATLKDWVVETQKATGKKVDVRSIRAETETELCKYLKSSSLRFDVVVSSFTPVSETVLESFTHKPKIIQAQGSGYNHIDIEACRSRNIKVCNNIDWCSTEVAEYVMAAILGSAGRLNELGALMAEGTWDRNAVPRSSVREATLGIVGYGKIGQTVESFARSFGMQVVICDPLLQRSVPLHDLLRASDYVSLHVPLTSETRALVGAAELALMKPGSVLINTSRGGVVSEQAILEALDDGATVRAYVADVFANEPLPASHPLRTHPRAVLTPHVAGKTVQSSAKAATQIAENLRRLLAGEEPLLREVAGDDLDRDVSDASDSDEATVVVPDTSERKTVTKSDGGPEEKALEPRTMRDIFDQLCRPGSSVMNLAAGMVEFEPPQDLRQLASDIVLGVSSAQFSEIPVFHMYRERKGDSIYVRGIQKLQEMHYGLGPIDHSNILATSGVSGGTISVFLALNERLGDAATVRIGLLDPFYIYHRDQALSVFGARAEFVHLPLGADGFAVDGDALRKAASTLDAVVFTNPGNPTARAFTPDDIAAVEAAARANPHCLFVSDEVYADMMIRGARLCSFRSPLPENIVVLRGFSKALAVGAWRLGYALGHKKTLETMATAHDRVFICANWTQMAVGSYIVNNYESFKNHTQRISKVLEANETLLADAFEKGLGWTLIRGDGSMFRLVRHTCETDGQAFQRVLDCGLAVVPGRMFSSPAAGRVGLVRIHLAFSTAKAEIMAARLLRGGVEGPAPSAAVPAVAGR